MKLIPLTQGQFAKVSDHIFDYLNQWGWSAHWDKTIQSFYAVRTQKGRTIYMHRDIMETPKNMICDHINHDTLDNQDHNLRNVTHSQSIMNTRTRSSNQLGEKCIQSQPSGGFRVHIRKGTKSIFTRNYKTIEDAIAARDEAIKKYHAEFAYLQDLT